MDRPLAPTAAVEIELKLAFPARAATRLLQHPLVAVAGGGPPRTQRLISVYYDTPQRDLLAAGVGLRLRRTAAGWIQTIKGPGSALGGLHRRSEYERPVPGEQLDLDLHDHPELAELFRPARVRKRLKPVFVTDFERSERMLQSGANRIAVSVDRGAIAAGKAREPISELELELLSGEPGALFDLAQALQAELPLRPLDRSKAARGYALAGVSAGPRKAGRIVLERQTTIGQALVAVVASGLEQLQANEHGMLAGGDSEFLHQMRVAVRRLRSVFAAYAAVAPGESTDALRRELKWAGGRLGLARDWDVFAAELLPPLLRELGADSGLAALADRTAGARERADRGARAAVRSRRYARLLLDLGRIAAADGAGTGPRGAEPALSFAARLLQRRHEQVVARGGRLDRRPLAELHRLRIAIKKLRYAAEFFASLFDEARVKPYRTRLAELQQSLGTINDQARMPELVHAAMPRRPQALEALVRGWNACAVHAERERLRDAWRRFRRTRKFW